MISQRNRSYNGRAMYNSSSSVNGNGTPAQNGTNGTTNNERSNGKPATATSNGKHRSSNGGKNGKMPQPLNGGCNGINDGSGPSTSDETNGGNNGRETALAARPRNGFGLLNGTSNSSDDMSSSTLQQCHANGRKGGKSCIGNTIKEHVNGKECKIEKSKYIFDFIMASKLINISWIRTGFESYLKIKYRITIFIFNKDNYGYD